MTEATGVLASATANHLKELSHLAATYRPPAPLPWAALAGTLSVAFR